MLSGNPDEEWYSEEIVCVNVPTPNTGAFGHPAANYWRGGPPAARGAWQDAGFPLPSKPVPDDRGFYVGALVEHDDYGLGKVVELSGAGALRRVKVRFRTGEQVFAGARIGLSVIDPENA